MVVSRSTKWFLTDETILAEKTRWAIWTNREAHLADALVIGLRALSEGAQLPKYTAWYVCWQSDPEPFRFWSKPDAVAFARARYEDDDQADVLRLARVNNGEYMGNESVLLAAREAAKEKLRPRTASPPDDVLAVEQCPSCARLLRLPIGRLLTFRCPKCGHRWTMRY